MKDSRDPGFHFPGDELKIQVCFGVIFSDFLCGCLWRPWEHSCGTLATINLEIIVDALACLLNICNVFKPDMLSANQHCIRQIVPCACACACAFCAPRSSTNQNSTTNSTNIRTILRRMFVCFFFSKHRRSPLGWTDGVVVILAASNCACAAGGNRFIDGEPYSPALFGTGRGPSEF